MSGSILLHHSLLCIFAGCGSHLNFHSLEITFLYTIKNVKSELPTLIFYFLQLPLQGRSDLAFKFPSPRCQDRELWSVLVFGVIGCSRWEWGGRWQWGPRDRVCHKILPSWKGSAENGVQTTSVHYAIPMPGLSAAQGNRQAA